jgi:hypothetical protein
MLRRPVPGSNQGQRVQGPRRQYVVAQRGRLLPGSSLAHSLPMDQEKKEDQVFSRLLGLAPVC